MSGHNSRIKASISDLIWGKPLTSEEEEGQKVGVGAGLPMLGLDGLASAAYGPEAALAILAVAGSTGTGYVVQITGVILAVLAILYFSYRQTIHAYPQGGGGYTVARENLGTVPGLLAASALLIDYILTAAVGISAGVGALISAAPSLQVHTLSICLLILAFITFVNLRGARESGLAVSIPTYGFILGLGGIVLFGVVRVLTLGHVPSPLTPIPPPGPALKAVTLWLLLRSFASGCTAMTGVEAVSNGIPAFKKPATKYASATLTWIIAVLAVLLAGIAFLARSYHISVVDATDPNYQSVLSQVLAAVVGKGIPYYVVMAFVLGVLALSANTAFADFPRLTRLLALDGYFPHVFTIRGRRLVYTTGIVVLSVMCAFLLMAFRGITDALIPLYAVGAFLAFTLSQAGMVVHWMRRKGKGWQSSLAVNLTGCIATSIALAVIVAAKFVEGAWVTVLLIPAVVAFSLAVRRHYHHISVSTRSKHVFHKGYESSTLVIVPIHRWSTISERALRYAVKITDEVRVVHIATDEQRAADFHEDWEKYVAPGLSELPNVRVTVDVVHSPYRKLVTPLLQYIKEQRRPDRHRIVSVLVPELVERHWYEHFLHNQRATALKAALLFGGDSHTVVVNIPWRVPEKKRIKL